VSPETSSAAALIALHAGHQHRAQKHADAAMCVGKQNGKRRLHREFTLQTG